MLPQLPQATGHLLDDSSCCAAVAAAAAAGTHCGCRLSRLLLWMLTGPILGWQGGGVPLSPAPHAGGHPHGGHPVWAGHIEAAPGHTWQRQLIQQRPATRPKAMGKFYENKFSCFVQLVTGRHDHAAQLKTLDNAGHATS